jgi:hypothetical protein
LPRWERSIRQERYRPVVSAAALLAVSPERRARRSDWFAVFPEALLDSETALSFPECRAVPAVSLDR